jgi:putative peptidoglycan lipid II flippase
MTAAAGPTLSLVFQGGRFGEAQTIAAAPLLRIMLLAVPLWNIQQILGRGFYARGDTLTPALTGSVVTVLSLPFFFWAAPLFGAEGVAWVTWAGVLAYVLLITGIWLRRHGVDALAGVGGVSLRCVALSLVPAIGAWWISLLEFPCLPVVLGASARLALSLAAFACLYLVSLKLFAPDFLAPLRRIWKRK